MKYSYYKILGNEVQNEIKRLIKLRSDCYQKLEDVAEEIGAKKAFIYANGCQITGCYFYFGELKPDQKYWKYARREVDSDSSKALKLWSPRLNTKQGSLLNKTIKEIMLITKHERTALLKVGVSTTDFDGVIEGNRLHSPHMRGKYADNKLFLCVPDGWAEKNNDVIRHKNLVEVKEWEMIKAISEQETV